MHQWSETDEFEPTVHFLVVSALESNAERGPRASLVKRWTSVHGFRHVRAVDGPMLTAPRV